MAGGKASSKKLSLTKRRLAVLALRIQGATFRDIADHLNSQEGEDGIEVPASYDYSQARKDAMYVLRQLNKASEGYAAEIRRLDLERLDELLFAYWPSALKGDYMAFDRVMSVIAQRAKLENLNAPVKVALTDSEGKDRPVDDLEARRANVVAQVLAGMGIQFTEVENGEQDGASVETE